MKNLGEKNLAPGSFRFCIIFCIVLILAAVPASSIARTDIRSSMVKIYSVQNQPDYDNPWNMSGPQASNGSGCIISGNRILTNAHVVSDQTFLQVRLHGQSMKHRARVIAVSHETDLALLTVDDPSFFKRTKPLKLGSLPEIEQEVIVYGFPEGGDTLSTTKGVVSRIEDHRYDHSQMLFLAGQIDAAINPGNSGGPVIVNNRIVGVVMQGRRKLDNIGYMVPVPVIKHFLIDMEDGHYDGFPDDGVIVQSSENEGLKNMLGLNDDRSGALVVFVYPGSAADGKIKPGDVIFSVDGHPVADDCTVEFRPAERTRWEYYIQKHQIGEYATLEVLRQGKVHTIKFALEKNNGSLRLVPKSRYDVRPTYYVYGGLVFCPLTFDYIRAWGDEWYRDAPSNLVNYYFRGRPVQEKEEVVIIIKVLPFDLNNGYEKFTDMRIVEVNGKKIRNLRHLVSIVESGSDNPFVVFKTKRGSLISLDRKKVKENQTTILDVYKIAADRSPDLQKL